MKTYFNTTNLSGPDLFTAQEQTVKQDKTVLDYCRKLKIFSPTKLWKEKEGINAFTTYQELTKKAPLTSIRRSLNTLVKGGYVEQLETKVDGDFGRKEYLYQVC